MISFWWWYVWWNKIETGGQSGFKSSNGVTCMNCATRSEAILWSGRHVSPASRSRIVNLPQPPPPPTTWDEQHHHPPQSTTTTAINWSFESKSFSCWISTYAAATGRQHEIKCMIIRPRVLSFWDYWIWMDGLLIVWSAREGGWLGVVENAEKKNQLLWRWIDDSFCVSLLIPDQNKSISSVCSWLHRVWMDLYILSTLVWSM